MSACTNGMAELKKLEVRKYQRHETSMVPDAYNSVDTAKRRLRRNAIRYADKTSYIDLVRAMRE